MNFLVIGEYCNDIRRECEITRLSPEAPIPILKPSEICQTTPGMAANVLENLWSLGAMGSLISNQRRITKTRYIDKQSGYIVARVDEYDEILENDRFPKWQGEWTLKNCDGIIISDYNKGFLSEENIEYIATEALRQGIPTFLDTKKKLDSYAKSITVVKINEKEFRAQGDSHPLWGFAQNIVVTLGGRGCVWFNQGIDIVSEPVKVYDVCGAGDTFLAAFAIKYVETGGDIPKAMEYGNKAARVAVSHHGIVAVKKEEII